LSHDLYTKRRGSWSDPMADLVEKI
jgi:hypothetical protein